MVGADVNIVPTDGSYRVDVSIPARPVASFIITSPYKPTTSSAGKTLLIWSRTELLVIDIEGDVHHRVTCSEPIQSVAALDDGLLVAICDTYVSVVDQAEWREQIVFRHDEIFVKTEWEGRRLLLTDLRDRQLTVDF